MPLISKAYGGDREWPATPLMCAILRNHVDMVELLLVAGADIDLQDANGYTALTHAIICRNVEVGKILVESGGGAADYAGQYRTILRDRLGD